MEKIKINQQISFLRKKRGITQEELAKAIGVTNQAVSKWELGVCCPDIQLLPDIARYFEVSMDRLFGFLENTEGSVKKIPKEEKKANGESDTVFAAYEKKIGDGSAETKDFLAYAELLDKYAWDYIKKAETWYRKTMTLTQKEQSEEYFQAQKKMMKMFVRIGRSETCIKQCRQQLDENPDFWWNYYILAFVCKERGEMEEAWDILQKALGKFAENALLYELAGEVCRDLELYEKALDFWTKAYETDSGKCSVLYSQAYLYEKLEKYERAVQTWEEIIRWRHEHRQDENHELDWPLIKIHELQQKINK